MDEVWRCRHHGGESGGLAVAACPPPALGPPGLLCSFRGSVPQSSGPQGRCVLRHDCGASQPSRERGGLLRAQRALCQAGLQEEQPHPKLLASDPPEGV